MTGVHPRVSVSGLSFERDTPLSENLEQVTGAGFRAIGLHRDKLAAAGWTAGIGAAGAAPLDLAYLVHRRMFSLADPTAWEPEADAAIATVEAAATLGAPLVYATSGPRVGLGWEAAWERFAEAVAPVRERATSVGVRLAIETAPTQFADINIVHTLRDAVDQTTGLGLDICFDTSTCWTERDLERSIRRGVERIALVQVNDYVPGERGLGWAVPGDGAIPLREILAAVLDAGYAGNFDLKLKAGSPGSGAGTLRRGADRLGAMLEELGA